MEWGARKASRRSSVAARTKSPGGTTRQYSARDHRECTRNAWYFASPRLASPPFSFRSSKSEFLYYVHTRTRTHTHIYIYIGEKSEFIDPPSDLSFSILILPSPFLLPSIFFIYVRPTQTDTLLYPTLVKTIRPLVNLLPRFSPHIRLTGKNGGRKEKDGNLRSSVRSRSTFESISSQFLTSFLRPISIENSALVYQYRNVSTVIPIFVLSLSPRISCIPPRVFIP